MVRPRVCIIKTDGINRDEEMSYAFTLVNGMSKIVHINALREGKEKLNRFQILGIPGGFSYGDDVAAGRIMAIELLSLLRQQIEEFVKAGGLVLGVCNGFQVLMRTGLLPLGELGKQRATLTLNKSGHFECRWVRVRVEASKSIFTRGYEGQIWHYPVAHGEGRFEGDEAILNSIEAQKLVGLRYVDEVDRESMRYPTNPNGSPHAIAGLTDPTGRIFGLMPHPECFVMKTQHPNWRRRDSVEEPDGILLFRNAVQAVEES